MSQHYQRCEDHTRTQRRDSRAAVVIDNQHRVQRDLKNGNIYAIIRQFYVSIRLFAHSTSVHLVEELEVLLARLVSLQRVKTVMNDGIVVRIDWLVSIMSKSGKDDERFPWCRCRLA
jgi:hypothetical protein